MGHPNEYEIGQKAHSTETYDEDHNHLTANEPGAGDLVGDRLGVQRSFIVIHEIILGERVVPRHMVAMLKLFRYWLTPS